MITRYLLTLYVAVTPDAVILVESLATVIVAVLEAASYLSSPEYMISAVWPPASNVGSLTLAVPSFTGTVSMTLPSTVSVTFPFASLGSLTSTVALSPHLMSDGIVISAVESFLETVISLVSLAVLYLPSPE